MIVLNFEITIIAKPKLFDVPNFVYNSNFESEVTISAKVLTAF
jgi:hypothetical protein